LRGIIPHSCVVFRWYQSTKKQRRRRCRSNERGAHLIWRRMIGVYRYELMRMEVINRWYGTCAAVHPQRAPHPPRNESVASQTDDEESSSWNTPTRTRAPETLTVINEGLTEMKARRKENRLIGISLFQFSLFIYLFYGALQISFWRRLYNSTNHRWQRIDKIDCLYWRKFQCRVSGNAEKEDVGSKKGPKMHEWKSGVWMDNVANAKQYN